MMRAVPPAVGSTVNDEVDWRVYEYHRANPQGRRRIRKPKFDRPPEIKAIWHNAFHAQITKNRGWIQNMLAASADLFYEGDEGFREMAENYRNLVTSKGEAVRLSQRINARQLNIPLNPEFEGKLALVGEQPNTLSVGGLDICVIGPFWQDLL